MATFKIRLVYGEEVLEQWNVTGPGDPSMPAKQEIADALIDWIRDMSDAMKRTPESDEGL